MRYINVKQFHSKFFEEVKDLPVTITKFGRPEFVVSPIVEGGASSVENKEPPENMGEVVNLGYCKLIGCSAAAEGEGHVFVNGEWKEAPMCSKHMKSTLKEKEGSEYS